MTEFEPIDPLANLRENFPRISDRARVVTMQTALTVKTFVGLVGDLLGGKGKLPEQSWAQHIENRSQLRDDLAFSRLSRFIIEKELGIPEVRDVISRQQDVGLASIGSAQQK